MSVETLQRAWSDLLFGIRRSVRYHNRRRMFFERFNLFTNTISVIFGSATVFAVMSMFKDAAVATAVVVTIFSAIDLVVGTAKNARLHEDLARRFIGLEKEMVKIGEDDATESDLRRITEERLTIEADEPPVLKVLDSICHNELMQAMGYPKEKLVRIGNVQRMLANFFDFREHSISGSQ